MNALRKTFFVLAGLVFVVLLAFAAFPFRHWVTNPTTNAICLPAKYLPESNHRPVSNSIRPYVPSIHRTQDSLKIVKEFYNDALALDDTAVHNRRASGHWKVNEVRENEFLYQCVASLNWEEAERGCIYIRERDNTTIVERIWLYSATSAPMCEWYMSELPYGAP